MRKDRRLEGAPMTQNNTVAGTQVRIHWDDSSLKSGYANVFNVGISRAEIVLLLGMGQISPANRKELRIRLSDRIVMNPFAAKRLATLLNRVIRDYEFRFGSLHMQGGPPEDPTTH